MGRLKVGKRVLRHGHSKGRQKSGTWHTALYKDIRKIFFFIVITATRRLKRHTPCKTSRQKNGRETVFLSFRGKQGRHKADLPCSPLLDDYKRPTYYHSKDIAIFQLTAEQQDCSTAPTAWLTNNRSIKSRHKKPVFCSSVLTSLTRLKKTDLLPLKNYPQQIHSLST